MSEETRRHRDFIQNITIALLSASMVLLLTQTLGYNLGGSSEDQPYWSLFSTQDPPAAMLSSDQETHFSAPVQVVLSSPYGRYGNITCTTTDESFEALRILLEQALGSTRTHSSCSEQTFLNALNGTSIYYDFLSPLPLSLLADLVWTSSADEETYVQRLALALHGDRVTLYLWDGQSQFLLCNTSLSSDDLVNTINQYELTSAQFAFDSPRSPYRDLNPYSLLLEEAPVIPVLNCEIPQFSTDYILSALGFNPNTQNRYPDSSGNEIITEVGRRLQIRTDGTVMYQSNEDTTLSIKAAEEVPSLLEAVTGTAALLRPLLSPTAGSSSFYLQKIHQSDASTTLEFGYQANGVPIYFADGQSPAVITLNGTAVSSMILRFRQYTNTEAHSLLLPLDLAAAIAAKSSNAQLLLGYTDNGADTMQAQWLVHKSRSE